MEWTRDLRCTAGDSRCRAGASADASGQLRALVHNAWRARTPQPAAGVIRAAAQVCGNRDGSVNALARRSAHPSGIALLSARQDRSQPGPDGPGPPLALRPVAGASGPLVPRRRPLQPSGFRQRNQGVIDMPDLSPAQRQRMREAIQALPKLTRTVFLAHLLRGDDYPMIAAREGLTGSEVERHIADAIVLIDLYLTRLEPGSE